MEWGTIKNDYIYDAIFDFVVLSKSWIACLLPTTLMQLWPIMFFGMVDIRMVHSALRGPIGVVGVTRVGCGLGGIS